MKWIRRITAMLLAISMSVMQVSAITFTDVSKDEAIAVERMVSLGVFAGYEDGTFRPDSYLTRAEASAVMVRLLGKKEPGKMTTDFIDVPRSYWASGYITVAASNGILKGKGNGIFDPNSNVTYAEFATMLIRALKADRVAEADTIGWPDNYLNLAYDIDLFDGVSFSRYAPAKRGEVAKMANNVLDKKVWERSEGTTGGDSTYKRGDKTFLEDVLEIDEYTEVKITETRAVNENLDDDEVTLTKTDDTEKNGEDFNSSIGTVDLASGVRFDLDGNLGNIVDVWINDNDEIVMIAEAEGSRTETIRFSSVDNVDDSRGEITLVVDGEEEEYDLSEELKVFINNREVVDLDGGPSDNNHDELAAEYAFAADRENTMGTITLDEDNEVTYIYANSYNKALVVERIRDDKIYHNDDVKGSYSNSDLDLEDEDYVIRDIRGRNLDIDDIDRGNLVMWAKEDDFYTVLVLDMDVSGEVEKIGSDYVYVDGDRYKEKVAGDLDKVDREDYVDLYLDYNDMVLFYEITDKGSVSDDYGIIVEVYVEDDSRTGEELMLAIMPLDGSDTKTYTYDDDETIDEAGASLYALADLNPAAAADLGVVDVSDFSVTALDANIAKANRLAVMGQLVRFDPSGDDVALLEFKDIDLNDDDEITEVYTAGDTSYDEDDMEFDLDGYTYRLTDDTIIYTQKKISVSDGKNDTLVEFEKVSINNLDDFATGDNHNVSVAEIDMREVGYVVISLDNGGNEVVKKTGDNYAIIIEAGLVDEDDDEFTIEVDVISSETGEREVLTIEELENDDLLDEEYVGARLAYSYDGSDILGNGIDVTGKIDTASRGKVAFFEDDYVGIVVQDAEYVDANINSFAIEEDDYILNDVATTTLNTTVVEWTIENADGLVYAMSTDGQTFALVEDNKADTLANIDAAIDGGDAESVHISSQTFTFDAAYPDDTVVTVNEDGTDGFEVEANIEVIEIDRTENLVFAGVERDEMVFVSGDLNEIKGDEIVEGDDSDIDTIDKDLNTLSEVDDYADDIVDATPIWFYYGTGEESKGADDELVVIILYEYK